MGKYIKCSVFDNMHCGVWYYVPFWGKKIKSFFRCLKYAYQRAKYGFCEADAWNLDNYYPKFFINTLTSLRDNLHGAPSEFFDENAEEQAAPWREELTKIINYFKSALDCDEKEYDIPTSDYKKLLEEMTEVENDRQFYLKEGYKLICEHHRSLWD